MFTSQNVAGFQGPRKHKASVRAVQFNGMQSACDASDIHAQYHRHVFSFVLLAVLSIIRGAIAGRFKMLIHDVMRPQSLGKPQVAADCLSLPLLELAAGRFRQLNPLTSSRPCCSTG